MRCPTLLLRLSAIPISAGLAVLILSGISLLELEEGREGGPDEDTLQILERPPRKDLVSRSSAVPKLSEAEALHSLGERPGRAAIEALWPRVEQRERLFEILIAKDTREDVRLHLLGRFWEEEPGRALDAARSIAREDGISQGPLRLAAYEILAREGEEGDLSLLGERPFELHQTKTLREGYRDTLHARLHGGG